MPTSQFINTMLAWFGLKIAGAPGAISMLAGAATPVRCITFAITGAVRTGGGMISFLNPEASAIEVLAVNFDLTTKSTGACTVDCGVGATATTESDEFIDGLDVAAATGKFSSMSTPLHAQIASGKYFVMAEKTGDATGLVGVVTLFYAISNPALAADYIL